MEILLKKPTIKTFLPLENLPLNKSLILKLQIILLILLYIGIYRFFDVCKHFVPVKSLCEQNSIIKQCNIYI